jgi:Glycosyl hydrolase catalytic core
MSTKKGCVLGVHDPQIASKIQSVNPKWYYTWDVTPVPGLDALPFVPMIWGSNSISKLVGTHPIVLGFNEPDGSAQSNLTPAQALSLWPQVTHLGTKIGSPATAGNPTAQGSWLETFMAGDPRVDFVCVHWYAPPNASSFLKEIDAIYAKYNKPIWVTEFAVADWSGKFSGGFPVSLVEEFMRGACVGLDARPFVERYTWKTRATTDVNMGTSALFNSDGSLTDLGKIYSSI